MTLLHSLPITLALAVAGVALAQTPETPAPASAAARPEALPAPIPAPPALTARSYVLMDFETGQVLASKAPEQPVEPASITKLMTSYIVAAELGAGKIAPQDEVFISESAWRTGGAGTDGSTSFLKVGSRAPLNDLLQGMVIQSGNDASIALAEHVAGSEDTFAALMNDYARRLGLTGTHYANATGLPAEGHVTTALDVARLGRALIRDYPEHYRTYSIKQHTINNITQHNRNTLLWRDASVDGLKTGHTSRAGYCLAASARRGDTRMIAVVMGTSSEKVRADEAQALLNYGFRFFESHKLFEAGATVAEPELWKGADATARLGVANAAVVTIPRGSYERLKASVNIPKPLLAPLAKDQAIGTLAVSLDGKALLELPVVALADHPEGSFLERLTDSLALWWSSD